MSEEIPHPSLNSDDMDERILARRQRIAARLEQFKLGQEGDNKNEVIEEEKQTEGKKQIEKSYQKIVQLITGSTDLLTNVEVACDAREITLKKDESQSRAVRLTKLEEEVKAALEKFQQITKKWSSAVNLQDPQQLQELLKDQQVACDDLVNGKNALICDLQRDLKQKDDQYVKDLRKQAEDADLVLERMNEQIEMLKKTYREELDNIEDSLSSERKNLLDKQKKKWKRQSTLQNEKDAEYKELHKKHVEESQMQLQTLRVEDAEEYSIIKIKLETDVQVLEQNLQQMKATYQLNQEKLEYNFQVLKKRDEENMITKSQQKRKITRLQDLLNNLKVKLAKQEKQCREENQGLIDDLRRITQQHQELQKKCRHFQLADHKKFDEIWMMNEETAKDLLNDVLTEDRIIYEQQLGLEWSPPNLKCVQNVGPLRSVKKVERSAVELAQEIMTSPTKNSPRSDDQQQVSDTQEELMKAEVQRKRRASLFEGQITQQCMKNILELLCDEAGFLVEAKLLRLLAPIEKEDQSLVTLDAIFNALDIKSENDLYLLGKYFCVENGSSVDDLTAERSRVSVERTKLVHPNMVAKTLMKFLQDNKIPQKDNRKTMARHSEHRCNDSDEGYWRQLSSIIDAKKERVWDALTGGFEKYSKVLTERSQLIQDTDSLRQQNSELRMLLHQYLSSKVAQELQIPPTRVLQL